MGDANKTRDALNAYLESNQGDISAWFCLEENVLSSPLDYKLHCMLAELYATIPNHAQLARKHYCQSLELNPNYIRALFGLVTVASSSFTTTHGSSQQKKKNHKDLENNADSDDLQVAKELVKYGIEKILHMYKGNDAMSKTVRQLMETHRSYIEAKSES